MTQVLDLQRVRLPLLAGEKWWGGAVADGQAMPFGEDAEHHRDLAVIGRLPGTGPRIRWRQPIRAAAAVQSRTVHLVRAALRFRFDHGTVEAIGADLMHGRAGDSLADAFRTASAAFFPASGAVPAPQMFRAPQYNTWIEMPYRPTQAGVLEYAQGLLDAGLAAGRADDRRPVVARLRDLDIRPGHVPGPGRHGRARCTGWAFR